MIKLVNLMELKYTEKDLIGKTVTVRIPERDHVGKVIPHKYSSIKGKCVHYGVLPALGVKSITIGRTPVFPITDNDILKVE
jgi:hypothetical protein